MQIGNFVRIKAALGCETNDMQRVTMQNEGLGRTTPRERKKNKNKKKVGDTLHH
jgi:hypothetical protein